jgi:hypothetical protein
VSKDPKTNEAIEQLAKRHKPEFSKSYVVEYALVRLLDAMEAKQLTLPLVLQDRNDGHRGPRRTCGPPARRSVAGRASDAMLGARRG